jgi:hypothetical protein
MITIVTANLQAFCGSNSSSSKNVNRAGRDAALSFVKRAIARCHIYEEAGRSCFDEPPFKDMFVSATSHRRDPDSTSQGMVVNIEHLYFILYTLYYINYKASVVGTNEISISVHHQLLSLQTIIHHQNQFKGLVQQMLLERAVTCRICHLLRRIRGQIM